MHTYYVSNAGKQEKRIKHMEEVIVNCFISGMEGFTRPKGSPLDRPHQNQMGEGPSCRYREEDTQIEQQSGPIWGTNILRAERLTAFQTEGPEQILIHSANPAQGSRHRERTTAPRRPREMASSPIGCAGPALSPPSPTRPCQNDPGGECQVVVLPKSAAALQGSGFMAARPLSRMLRRLLASSARSCSSGAPVTQPRPRELPARAASEVSPPRQRPQLPWAGVARTRCPFPPRSSQPICVTASGRDPLTLLSGAMFSRWTARSHLLA
ncbi:hypothetical protein AAY473_006076 [Plecturocebus cupreus]